MSLFSTLEKFFFGVSHKELNEKLEKIKEQQELIKTQQKVISDKEQAYYKILRSTSPSGVFYDIHFTKENSLD